MVKPKPRLSGVIGENIRIAPDGEGRRLNHTADRHTSRSTLLPTRTCGTLHMTPLEPPFAGRLSFIGTSSLIRKAHTAEPMHRCLGLIVRGLAAQALSQSVMQRDRPVMFAQQFSECRVGRLMQRPSLLVHEGLQRVPERA